MLIVEGYPIVFNQPTEIYAGEYEVIDSGALRNCDMSDWDFLYNHGGSVLTLASIRGKSLFWDIDSKGLHIIANIADTQVGRDVYTLIKRQDIQKMSFAFVSDKGQEIYEFKTRRIMAIKRLRDCSIVTIPAYPGTSVWVSTDEAWDNANNLNSRKQKLINEINRGLLQDKLEGKTLCHKRQQLKEKLEKFHHSD